MSNNQQQFVKNTNKPPENSELWSVADEWKISQQTGLTYTPLDNVYKTQNDHQFHDALVQQLNGEIKQSIDIGIGYLFVASYSQNGKALVYAYDPSRKEDADKRASYNKSQQQESQQKLETVPNAQSAITTPKISLTGTPIHTTHVSQLQSTVFTKKIEVVQDVIPIEWNDAPAIENAMKRGLYVLPVERVG